MDAGAAAASRREPPGACSWSEAVVSFTMYWDACSPHDSGSVSQRPRIVLSVMRLAVNCTGGGGEWLRGRGGAGRGARVPSPISVLVPGQGRGDRMVDREDPL